MENALSARIQDWLLTSEIQIEYARERGAIVGWLENGSIPTYAYPEITGYYLTCMAFVAASEPSLRSEASARSGLAFKWLDQQSSAGDLPLTRVYLRQAADDWRNEAVFSFDLGMVVRGISAAITAGLIKDQQSVLDRYLGPLRRLTADDILLSHRERPGGGPAQLPDRWSTLPGPHHVKVSSALMLANDTQASSAARRIAEKTAEHWMNRVGGALPLPELHPSLYFIEGLLLLGIKTGEERYVEQATVTYTKVMSYQRTDGTLPACIDGTDSYVRSDVLGQALRAGAILVSLGRLSPEEWTRRLSALAEVLASYTAVNGGVLFERGRPSGADHVNVWASIFAYQAYTLWRSVIEKDDPNEELFLLLA